jgi:hypothetical protein
MDTSGRMHAMHKALHYVFTTSETGHNYAPKIYLEPLDKEAAAHPEMIFFELNPGTTVAENDALAETLRRHVVAVSFQPKPK